MKKSMAMKPSLQNNGMGAAVERADTDILHSFMGLELHENPGTRMTELVAVMETVGGKGLLLDSNSLMRVQMEYSMVKGSHSLHDPRRALLEAEDTAAAQASLAIELAQKQQATPVKASRPTAAFVPAAGRFPAEVRQAASTALGKYVSKKLLMG